MTSKETTSKETTSKEMLIAEKTAITTAKAATQPAETVIIGLGETGFACARFLAQRNIPCVVLDSRSHPPKMDELQKKFPQIPIYTGGFNAAILAKAKTLILSPGISKDLPDFRVLPPTSEIIGDIELFVRHASAPIVAITGSNGKSTVTTLLGEMAKAAGLKVGVGGNLGIPALDLLDPTQELYILELSSFQLETTYSLHAKVATILNITPDHMDRYETFEQYLTAKLRIFQHCEKIVFNRQDPLVENHLPAQIAKISFGLDAPTEGMYGLWEDHLALGKTPLLSLKALKLFGRHNVANALAALALGASVGLPQSAMLTALKTFKGLPHRCEWVRELADVQWINDSKGTNVGATVSALQGLREDIRGKWILIAGGVAKNADFSPLKAVVAECCRQVILIGEAGSELQTLLQGEVPCVRVNSLSEAVKQAQTLAETGDGVLLSPACASFDMFRNFEDRGEVFKKEVLALI